MGGNEEAARRSASRSDRTYISVFVVSSSLAALGGLMAAGLLTSVSQASGTGGTELTAIAAAVIGGTSLFGGRGTAYSAMLGIIVLQAIASGLNQVDVDSSVRFMTTGGVLLLAVMIDSVRAGQAPRAAAARRSTLRHGREPDERTDLCRDTPTAQCSRSWRRSGLSPRRTSRRSPTPAPSCIYPPNWSLMSESTPADKAYVILSGEVEIRQHGEIVATVGSGGIIGEIGILEHRLRTASVISRTELEVVHYTKEKLSELVEQVPALKEIVRVRRRRPPTDE